ncbi:S9 family peptidase, partial [bacterium]
MRIRFVLLALLTVFVVGSASADLLTIDKFVSMTRCSDPQISPDGRVVAFVASVPDTAANRSNTDIWLVSADGKVTRKLTNSDAAD